MNVFRLWKSPVALAALLFALTPVVVNANVQPTIIHLDVRNMTDRYAYVIYADYAGERHHTGTFEHICIPPHGRVERTYKHTFKSTDAPWLGLTAGTMTRDCKDGGATSLSSRHFITKNRENNFITEIFENHIGLALDPKHIHPPVSPEPPVSP